MFAAVVQPLLAASAAASAAAPAAVPSATPSATPSAIPSASPLAASTDGAKKKKGGSNINPQISSALNLPKEKTFFTRIEALLRLLSSDREAPIPAQTSTSAPTFSNFPGGPVVTSLQSDDIDSDDDDDDDEDEDEDEKPKKRGKKRKAADDANEGTKKKKFPFF
jgi:hypothetical protein